MWNLKKSAGLSDTELQSLEHRNALLSKDYNAHPCKTSSIDTVSKGSESPHPRWKIGIRYCALAGSLVFLLNTIFLLVGEGRAGFPNFSSNEGKRVLYDGQCATTKKINIGVHLLINILSTILLGASNYCMQCMSAPTRAEAEQAHAKFRWVDIGTPSIRNLGKIRGLRVVLWLLLGISSLPLHLFYNSTVFASITANEYMIFSVSQGFVDPSADNFTRIDITRDDAQNVINHMFDLSKAGNLERLSNAECVNAYAQNYQTERGNVLLVVSNSTEGYTNEAVADYETQVAPIISLDGSYPNPFDWICEQYPTDGESCGNWVSKVQSGIEDWKPFRKPVQYCISEKVDQHCRLEYSAHLLLVVVLIGLLKTTTMLYIAFRVEDVPMLTIGDAVSSFLSVPDAKTKGLCLLDKRLKHFKPSINYTERTESGAYSSMGWVAPPKYFRYCRKRHFTAASGRRWFAFLGTFVVLIGASIFLLQYGVYWYGGGGDDNKSRIYTQGLGVVDPRAFINWTLPTTGAAGLISNVVVANTPQILLSFLYLNYNGLMTVMSLAHEWSRYGIRRNGLRVSATPKGAQRTTYFLQLPYRFGIPIIIATGTLHWLISQSIFLVSVEAIMLVRSSDAVLGDPNVWDTAAPEYLMTCGYSPSAILASIIVASLLLIWIVCMSFIKLPSSMPVAASCSAAIAAACHVPVEEIDELSAEKELMWGDMGEDEKGIGHCGFSMKDVERPADGKLYA